MTRARDLAAFVSNADGDIKFDTDTLFIDSSANRVGIGRTDPAHPLDVDGEVRFNSNIRLTEATSDAETGSINLADSGLMQIQAFATGGEIAFDTGSSATERMRIDSSGNVHITDNTNGPDAALHIEKTTPEIRLQINGNSGYNWIKSAANNELTFGKSGNEYLRILSAGGLTFNGDTAAANALDDYEEGTWSPVFSHASNTYALSNQVGYYVKIGKLVFISARLDVSSRTGSSSGAVQISSLPFTTASLFESGMTPMQANTGPNRIMIYCGPNRNYLQPYKNDHGSGYSTLQGTELNAGDSLIFNLTYYSN